MEKDLKAQFKDVCALLSEEEKKRKPELNSATRKVRRVVIRIVQMSDSQIQKSGEEEKSQYEN